MWSPLPPERSGIADYTYELLGPLADEVAVTAVSRSADATAPVPLVTPAAATGLPVYQMGNHAGVHTWIYRQALAVPGVVVLHDTSLLDFHQGYHGGIGTPAFRDEVAFAHGPIWGDPQDPALLNGWPAVEADGPRYLDAMTMTMERRLAAASRGFIVHDPYSADRLRARYPGLPVSVVNSGAPVRDDADRAAVRARLGWDDGHVVFGVFGGFNRIKRILVVVLAFAQVRRRWPRARLLIAGHVDYPEVHADVVRALDQYGLRDSVRMELSPAKDDFEQLIGATDAVVNLRWPTAGETSAVMMRAFGAGRPVITSDLPQNRHYAEEFCWRVPIESRAEAEALAALLEQVVTEPGRARAAGELARDWVAREASWPVVARQYREALESAAEDAYAPDLVTAGGGAREGAANLGGSGQGGSGRGGRSGGRRAFRPVELVERSAPGVNLFADTRATTGLSESFRRAGLALLGTDVGLTYTEFNSRAPVRTVQVPRELAELRAGKDYPVDLWMVNLNEFQLIPDSSLDRYTIALWAWELPEILDYTLVQLPRLDELWVVSSFVGDAFRTVTDIPITVVPNVVPEVEAAPDRARFGLAEDAFVVLFTFSSSSSDARKNPWGVIDAFRRAFAPHERGTTAHLVIKAIDLDIFPLMAAALADAVASVNGTLIAEDLTRPEMDALLASCDVYASLHRSEGYGLGMAEAMMLGKPVVATGYGGNTDFMPPGAAATVGYDIRPITEKDHRYDNRFADWYRPGQLWAEPDVAQAAGWLRRLADSPALRARMGARARKAIRAHSGAEAVGAVMRDRVHAIYREGLHLGGVHRK
ncbi:glycosyltransferase family 4 protein [Saccharothrix australiensis]|uniref:Glycosyltransferase involved in cell wall biosynthesis n=1 Tax=Saccharothrix australiensis TaxID=2072 RepID=A0A495VR84_9PSEU|nr:glycosyltransferase family 4 protein [Saccharothrix australiensis]RKT51906.1 glycosyltransferase involved in cell wall biosynthesis [Saccharothrix australiensis]